MSDRDTHNDDHSGRHPSPPLFNAYSPVPEHMIADDVRGKPVRDEEEHQESLDRSAGGPGRRDDRKDDDDDEEGDRLVRDQEGELVKGRK